MSEADTMFEELGYKKGENITQKGEIWGEHYINKYSEIIKFDFEDKQVCCYVLSEPSGAMYFNMQELQAINQKCKDNNN